ncbi:hypothetical protein OAN22_00290 [Alphaproteobacteria bacterium]|nr:hypothetical protein [Alphaproteobacteria bacterium]
MSHKIWIGLENELGYVAGENADEGSFCHRIDLTQSKNSVKKPTEISAKLTLSLLPHRRALSGSIGFNGATLHEGLLMDLCQDDEVKIGRGLFWKVHQDQKIIASGEIDFTYCADAVKINYQEEHGEFSLSSEQLGWDKKPLQSTFPIGAICHENQNILSAKQGFAALSLIQRREVALYLYEGCVSDRGISYLRPCSQMMPTLPHDGFRFWSMEEKLRDLRISFGEHKYQMLLRSDHFPKCHPDGCQEFDVRLVQRET